MKANEQGFRGKVPLCKRRLDVGRTLVRFSMFKDTMKITNYRGYQPMRKLFLSCLILVAFAGLTLQAQDGIPDNCESDDAPIYPANVFARYEPAPRRLVLVDWNTGGDVFQIASDLDETLIRGWSLNCHYLAVAIGNDESRDTVVFDTQTGAVIGRVLDAQTVPHTITWGPGDFLVVETRSHAILWDVRRNIQYTLDVGFNTTTHRNFSRIRWDADNQQVLFNLAVGGRVAYDLTTGQETVITRSRPGELILGGESFVCSRERHYPLGSTVPNLGIFYAADGDVLYIGSRYSNGYRSSTHESLQTLEAGTAYVNIVPKGWSANCRYVAVALNPDDNIADVYDTVIWDVIEQRRVGVFPDANLISHPITWDTAENFVLIETRDGAYLWNLQTDERILVNSEVMQIPSSCYEYGDDRQYCTHYPPRSFHSIYWDAGRQQMLAVPVHSPDSVVAYDVNTGAEVNRLIFETTPDSRPVQFITSDDSRILVTLLDGEISIVDRETNAILYRLNTGIYNLESYAAISLDNRYLAVFAGNRLLVWDIQAQAIEPTYIHENTRFRATGGVGFVNGEVIVNGSRTFPMRINVVTGEVSGDGWQTANEINYQPVVGTSGFSEWRFATSACPDIIRHDEVNNTIQVLDITGNLNGEITGVSLRERYQWFDIGLSPDCRTLYTHIVTSAPDLLYEEIPEFYATEVAFWNIETGEEIAAFGTRQTGEWGTYRAIYWSPTGERAFVGALDGFYILDTETAEVIDVEQTRLTGGRISYYPSSIYWNYERGIVFISYLGQVSAFNMTTGDLRLQFTPTEYYGNPYFEFSDDGNWIFIYARFRLGVWNLNTLENHELAINSGGHRGVAISPDGRYLAVARSVLRVFDLQGDTSSPIFMPDLGARDIETVRFSDATTVELVVNSVERRETLIIDILAQTVEVSEHNDS